MGCTKLGHLGAKSWTSLIWSSSSNFSRLSNRADVGRSIFTSACLLYPLSLKLHPFRIFHPFPTLNYSPFQSIIFKHIFTQNPIIFNIFPINPIISTRFEFKYFHSTFIPIKLYILYIFHSFNHYTYRFQLTYTYLLFSRPSILFKFWTLWFLHG